MDGVADGAARLAVTSPPYWQLKDYGNGAQIGFNDSYEDYINNLSLVWAECLRILENGCRLCVNIGDQFARAVYYGRYKVIPIKTEIIKSCEALGFDYMGTIIWQKTATTNTTGGGAVMGSYPYPRNGIVKIDYESILLFKKRGEPPRRAVDKRLKEKSKLTAAEWNVYFSGHWKFPGVRQNGHIAMFPPELPNRLIKMFSFAGDLVLDPFMGGGATACSAANLERHSVGYEINGEYEKIMREKFRAAANPPGGADIEFVREKNPPGKDELREKIAALPYACRD
ncbi:MAG: site-specific DNA-methyltransferase, partial [Betaproteobacteria bacterium]|nr:site-specific DNA-methyltransferase [Betaproteobacteria bacterium]